MNKNEKPGAPSLLAREDDGDRVAPSSRRRDLRRKCVLLSEMDLPLPRARWRAVKNRSIAPAPGMFAKCRVMIEEPDRLARRRTRIVTLLKKRRFSSASSCATDEQIVELSTLDFLRILEAEGRASNPPSRFSISLPRWAVSLWRAEKMSGHDEATRAAIRELVQRRGPGRRTVRVWSSARRSLRGK